MDYQELELHHRRLTENPADPTSFAVLRDFFEQQRQNGQLAELYEFRALHLSDPRDRAAHLFQAATIWLDRDGNQPKGLRDLQEAFRADPTSEPVGDRLEEFYREGQDFAALTALVTERIVAIERLGDVPETAKLRSRLYQNIGEIKDKVEGDAKDAIRYYKRAFTVDPTNVLALYLAREIYRQAGDVRSALKLCELEVNAEPNAARKVALLREMAILKAESLEDTNGAVESLERAVQVAPTDADAIYDLAMMLAKRAQTPAARPDDAARAADRLFQLSQVGNPAQAIDYLEYALDLVPGHEGVVGLYVRLTSEAGQVERQVERLRRCLAAGSIENAPTPLLRALGQIEWDQYRNAEAARPIFTALAARGDPIGSAKLAEVGGVPGAIRHGALASEPPPAFIQPVAPAPQTGDLDALFGDEPEPEIPARVQPRAAPASRAAAAPRAGEPRRAAHPSGEGPTRLVPPDLADALASAAEEAVRAEPAAPREEIRALAAEPEGAQDVEGLRDQARKLKMAGKDDRVETIMERIVEAVPGDAEAVAYLERRYRAKGNFAGLHKMLMGAGLSRNLPQNARVMRLKEAAALAEGRLGDADGAVVAWQRILTIDPTHGDARRSLERLLRKLERWADMVELMEQRVQMAEDEAEKLTLLGRIASIQETSLADPAATLDTMWRIHGLDETNTKHLKKIEMLAEQAQRWDDLARALLAEADRSENSQEKLRAREKLLAVQHERLQSYSEALETVDSILVDSPGHLPTLKRQIDLLEATVDWSAAADALDALTAKLPEKERPASLRRLAAIARTELKDLARAADALRRALAIDSANEEVREELHKMYEELGRHADIAASFEEWAKAVRDPARRKSLLRKAANVLDQQVGDLEAACERWAVVLKEGDDQEALEAFARLHEMQGDWNALVDNIVRRAGLAAAGEDKARLLTEAARILDDRLDQPGKAAGIFQRILDEVSPDNHETLSRLVDAHVRAGGYAAAAAALEKLRELTDDPDDALKHSETLGEWYRGPLADPDKATATYERIVASHPTHTGGLLALCELYDQLADFEKLLRVLRARSKAVDSPVEQAQLLLEGARVAENKLKDAGRAWGWFQEALQRNPTEGDLFDAVCEAGRRLEKWESLAGVYEAAATRTTADEERVGLLREAAKVWEQDAKTPLHALEDIVEAVRTLPSDDTLLAEADRLARLGAHWEILGKAYDLMLRRADMVDDRVALLRRFATTVTEDGRKPEFALGPLVHAMEERPDDEELFDLYEQAARKAGRHEDLLRAFDKRCRAEQDQGRRAALMLRAADVYASAVGNVEKALQIVGRAITQDPLSDELAEQAMRTVRSMEEKLPPQGKGQGWRYLVATYQRLAAKYDPTDPEGFVFHRRMVTVHLDGEKDPAAAFESMKAAHLLAPTDEMLVQDLEKLARENDFLTPLVDHYADALQKSMRVDVAKDLHRRRAALLENQLERREEAADHYWQLLQLDPDDEDAREKLAGFYEAVGRWNDLVVILEDRLAKTVDDDERAALLTRIALIWEEKIGNRYEAIDVYRKVARLRPDDGSIAATIKRLSAPRLAGSGEDDDESSPSGAPGFEDEPAAPIDGGYPAGEPAAGTEPPEGDVEAAPAAPDDGSGESASVYDSIGGGVRAAADEAIAADSTGADERETAAGDPDSGGLAGTVSEALSRATVDEPAAPGAKGDDGVFLPTWDEGDDSARLSASDLAWMATSSGADAPAASDAPGGAGDADAPAAAPAGAPPAEDEGERAVAGIPCEVGAEPAAEDSGSEAVPVALDDVVETVEITSQIAAGDLQPFDMDDLGATDTDDLQPLVTGDLVPADTGDPVVTDATEARPAEASEAARIDTGEFEPIDTGEIAPAEPEPEQEPPSSRRPQPRPGRRSSVPPPAPPRKKKRF